MHPADRVKKEEIEEEEYGRQSKGQEYTQLTPLMTQNGPAGMMMQQQMYQAGYQMLPSGYPSAPPTPGMIPGGAAPPPTVMYPFAPTPSHMHPGYQGYASGSSTPVQSNARSPARSRKAMGMDNTSSWLGQQHPHLGAPGTPGPGSPYASRAPSVMSTMTGFNDDAMSVMSVTSLVELQPATSHQTENIDPARIRAISDRAINLAHGLTQPEQALQAACGLAEHLNRSNTDIARLPKEVLNQLIQQALQALYAMRGVQLGADPAAMKLLGRIFSILHLLASASNYNREKIVSVCQSGCVFGPILELTCSSLQTSVFVRAIAFLNQLVRDQQADYAKDIMRVLAPSSDFFGLLFRQMINRQTPTAIEFMCRLLQRGDRRQYREKISELHVHMLIEGTDQHQGLLRRFMRKKENTEIRNILLIIEFLVRNEDRPTDLEKEIQRWFIDHNTFFYLAECLRMTDPRILQSALKIFADLAASPHISDEMATHIADLMVVGPILQLNKLGLQNCIIFTLSCLSANRKPLQLRLVDTQVFNYACHLIKSYAKKEYVENNKGFVIVSTLLEEALNICNRQLQLDIPPEVSHELWSTAGDKTTLTSMFFDKEFVSCLLNILASGTVHEKLKTTAVQIMVGGLTRPSSNRIAPFLFDLQHCACDGLNGSNLVNVLFNAMNSAMMSPTRSRQTAAFLRSAADLLVFIVAESTPAATLANFAKLNSNNFPLNILFDPAFENDEGIVKKLLIVCKRLVEEDVLQQSWSPYRQQFTTLSISGNYEIGPIATHILGMLGQEDESDYNMMIANSFTS